MSIYSIMYTIKYILMNMHSYNTSLKMLDRDTIHCSLDGVKYRQNQIYNTKVNLLTKYSKVPLLKPPLKSSSILWPHWFWYMLGQLLLAWKSSAFTTKSLFFSPNGGLVIVISLLYICKFFNSNQPSTVRSYLYNFHHSKVH